MRGMSSNFLNQMFALYFLIIYLEVKNFSVFSSVNSFLNSFLHLILRLFLSCFLGSNFFTTFHPIDLLPHFLHQCRFALHPSAPLIICLYSCVWPLCLGMSCTSSNVTYGSAELFASSLFLVLSDFTSLSPLVGFLDPKLI